jgi:hypothetical protein
MSTIPIEANISTEQLLRAVEHLPRRELDAFVTQVLRLRARRESGSLNKVESDLLLQINAGWPAHVQQRHDELVAKREQETIAAEELQELIALTDEAEQRNVERLQALSALAALRSTTIPHLMTSLGLSAHAHG